MFPATSQSGAAARRVRASTRHVRRVYAALQKSGSGHESPSRRNDCPGHSPRSLKPWCEIHPASSSFIISTKTSRSEHQTRNCGVEAERRERIGDLGKPRRKQAKGDKNGDSFSRFRKAGGEEKRLLAPRCRFHFALFGDDRVGKEARAIDVKGKNQHSAGKRVRRWVREHKAQRDRAIEGEVENDVEIPAKVGRAVGSGYRTVEAISQTAEQDKGQARQIELPANRRRRQKADGAGGNGNRVRGDPGAGQPSAQPVEQRIKAGARPAIQH